MTRWLKRLSERKSRRELEAENARLREDLAVWQAETKRLQAVVQSVRGAVAS
jgi:FtsZ-binding cell division protein ZapB